MRRAALIACLLFGIALAQEGEALRLRLAAFFGAKDADSRGEALDALSAAPVPRELRGRVEAIRHALSLKSKKGASRISEKVLDHECFFVTPRGYDARKLVPAVVSFHGRNGDAHAGIQPFAMPDEEWDDIRRPIEEEAHKKYGANAKIRVERLKPKIDWNDGVVIGPSVHKADLDAEEVDAVTLAALERLLRTYSADPDRILVAGISLGGAAACQLAERHPDRFAGLVAVAGYDPNDVENLKPLQVYLAHGDKDDDVPVASGRQMDGLLKAASVTHVYREIKGGGHAWPAPEDCAKIRTWMHQRVRDPWPRDFAHVFPPSKKAQRCFWVEVPAGESRASIEASVKENEIQLSVRGAPSVVLHLAEPLVDLEKEVVVKWGPTEVFRGTLPRSWKTLLEDVEATGFDLPRASPARVEVKAP